jgi:hypothetical protein
LPAELYGSFKIFPESSECSNIATLRLEPTHTSSTIASCVHVVNGRSVQLHHISQRRAQCIECVIEEEGITISDRLTYQFNQQLEELTEMLQVPCTLCGNQCSSVELHFVDSLVEVQLLNSMVQSEIEII